MKLRAKATRPGPAAAAAASRRPADEVGTHPPRTPRSGTAAREHEPGRVARATARPTERCQAGALHRPTGWPRPAAVPVRGAARPPPGSPPPLGRARPGGRRRAAAAEGLGYLGGCWWLGSFPDGRGTSGRGSGVRTRRESGRDPSAETRQEGGLARGCRRSGGRRGGGGGCSCGSLRILLGLVQDGGAPCTGFPVTLAMGRTTKEGGVRAQPAEPGRGWWSLTWRPRPFLGPPHGPSRLKGAGKVVCASAVACPRLPGKLLRRFACCCLKGS